MKKLLVMGIGSRIMMDDAIGINITEDLKKNNKRPDVGYLLGETDFDFCFEEVLDSDYLIIIDAYMSGKAPGEISVISINETKGSEGGNMFSMHGIHLLNLLKRAKHIPEGILIGIEPCEIDYGFTLTDTLQSRYPDILAEVKSIIDIEIEKYGGKQNA